MNVNDGLVASKQRQDGVLVVTAVVVGGAGGGAGWWGGGKHNRDPLRCFKKGRNVFKGGSGGSEAGLCQVSG